MEKKYSEAIGSFLGVDRMHRRCIEKAVGGLNIHRSQHIMLMHLFRSGEPPTQKELADHLEISPAAVAATIKKLEKNGYITRVADRGDSRSNRVVLTDKGRGVLDRSRELFGKVDAAMLDGLTDAQVENMRACFEIMQSNLHKLYETI